MPINTIEEARDRILELEGQITELTNERDTLSQNNNALSTELESVRKLNQKYFDRLSAQYSEPEEEEEEEKDKPLSCAEFAINLKI